MPTFSGAVTVRVSAKAGADATSAARTAAGIADHICRYVIVFPPVGEDAPDQDSQFRQCAAKVAQPLWIRRFRMGRVAMSSELTRMTAVEAVKRLKAREI